MELLKQVFKQSGPISEKPNETIFPLMSDLVVEFSPFPGIYVRDNMLIPEGVNTLPVSYYDEDGDEEWVYEFIQAKPLSSVADFSGEVWLAYENDDLFIHPELAKILLSAEPTVIEHRKN